MANRALSNTFIFGGAENDSLDGSGWNVLIGLGGDDTLESQWTGAVLAGTDGNDTYLANGYMTEIIDTKGDDTLVLPDYASTYYGGFVGDDSLILYNGWTGDYVLILDFKGNGRIEHFETPLQTLSANQVESMVDDSGYSFSWSDVGEAVGLSGSEMESYAEIDSVVAHLDWSRLFGELSDAGNSDPATVAKHIDDQAMNGLLSDDAREVWVNSGMRSALESSEFRGIDQNVYYPVTPVSQDEAKHIALLYEGALDRSPDESGLNYWIDQYERGMSLEEVADRFIDSSEFKTRFNVSDDTDFIDQLYQNLLDREPDQSGRDWWINELASGARDQADVLIGFSVSQENEQNAAWVAGLQETSEGYWTLTA